MPIIIDSYNQGDPEWFKARLGNPGASNASKIITTNGKPSKQADDFMYQLAGEIITGTHEDGFQSQAMLRGLEGESEARELFSFIKDIEVRKVALVYKDEQKKFHCSPDGLMEGAGLELKCPMMKTQVKYLLQNKLPTEYFGQVQMSMYICGFEHWFFMSYYPGLEPLILEVSRDEPFISALAKELDKFIDELVKTIRKLKEAA